jgi:hypothetical protein
LSDLPGREEDKVEPLTVGDKSGVQYDLLKPGEVAATFRVDPKTVTRWANEGRLTTVRTLGGHRRYLAHQVNKLVADQVEQRQD